MFLQSQSNLKEEKSKEKEGKSEKQDKIDRKKEKQMKQEQNQLDEVVIIICSIFPIYSLTVKILLAKFICIVNVTKHILEVLYFFKQELHHNI